MPSTRAPSLSSPQQSLDLPSLEEVGRATRRRPWRSARRAVAVTAALLGLATGGASSATALAPGYYSRPWTADLEYVYAAKDGSHYGADYSSWARAGFPAAVPAPVDYVKYPWSTSLYGVTFWGGADVEFERLSFPGWQSAGSPGARDAGWIEGSDIYAWETSPEIFIDDPDGVIHKLSGPEWAAADFRRPEYQADEGFVKLAWAQEIFYLYSLAANDGYEIDGERWQEEGQPSPRVVPWLAGEKFYKYSWSPSIYYDGPTMSREITYGEWRAAGFPRPQVL